LANKIYRIRNVHFYHFRRKSKVFVMELLKNPKRLKLKMQNLKLLKTLLTRTKNDRRNPNVWTKKVK
uniref:Ovule protein n=1 Tax=Anisakis simplex TaxID=6269 RepID=A0A0M3KGP2_ANISI